MPFFLPNHIQHEHIKFYAILVFIKMIQEQDHIDIVNN